MILTFVKIVTNANPSSIDSSPICDSIERKEKSFLYYKNANFPNFRPTFKTQAGQISET